MITRVIKMAYRSKLITHNQKSKCVKTKSRWRVIEIQNVRMAPLQLPVSCQLDNKYGMFRILRAKGKTLSSGGFGVGIDREVKKDSGDEKKTIDYLFIEEVLFLHERGLLECLNNYSSSASNTLNSSQLYQMLPMLGISLPIYFVYSHLRSQDFQVMRHHPDRLALLRLQEDKKSEMSNLKLKVKKTIQTAEPPQIPESGFNICYDCYMPNAKFSKYQPGQPDFFVSATFFHQSQISFGDCLAILNYCQGIPFKVATVSDSGTVVILGLTNFGVPTICEKQNDAICENGDAEAASSKEDKGCRD
jgi:hypothetical protein